MNNHTKSLQILIKAMKIGGFQFFLLLLTLQCVQANSGMAQNRMNQKISLQEDQKTLVEILEKLEDKTDVEFTYSIQKVDVFQKTSIDVKEEPLSLVIKNLFRKLNIEYKVFNHQYIVLTKTLTPAPSDNERLSGQIKSRTELPIQFANVVLYDEQKQNLINGTISDELGKFQFDNLPAGRYSLSISFLGYRTLDTLVTVSTALDLGPLYLESEENIIDGVTVAAKRKLVRQQIDRLIMDVENSLLANRGDALEVLRSTPGVSVNNDEIRMIGKSAVGIMVNGKKLNLEQEDLIQYLRSIPSEDILNIEVITTPPAKYEAEGNSGLINIILKKAAVDSWNMQLRAGYLQRKYGSPNVGLTFNYNKNKLSLSTSLFFNDISYYQEQDDYAYFSNGLWYTSSPLSYYNTAFSGRIDLAYQLSPRWTIGGQYVQNRSDMEVLDNPYTPVFDYETNEILRYLRSDVSYIEQKPVFNSINLNNSFLMDTTGRKLDVNLDYFKYENTDSRGYEGVSVINQPVTSTQYYAGRNINERTIENISGTIDMEFPTEWATLSFGGKVTRTVSKNDISLFNSGLKNEVISEMPLESNDFTYKENLEAIYLSGTKKISDHLTTQVGVRVEAIQTDSKSENLNLNEPNDYVKIFPTAYLSYQKSPGKSIALSYSRRISRPSFWELNPNIFFINPFQTIVGNAFLQPSFTDNLELSHVTGPFNGRIYFSNEEDIFAQVPLADESTNLIVFANENYVDTKRFGISENYTFDRLKWWSSTNSIDINYTRSTFDLEETQDDLDGINSRISTSNDFSIPGDDHWSFNLSYWYQFKGVNYIFDVLPPSDLSASVQYQTLDKKWKFSLTANDILKQQAERLETTVNGVFQTARYYYDSRRLYLSISYGFGNKNISAKRHKTGNREERGRAGN